jgi:hypothetical protein
MVAGSGQRMVAGSGRRMVAASGWLTPAIEPPGERRECI